MFSVTEDDIASNDNTFVQRSQLHVWEKLERHAAAYKHTYRRVT